MACRIVINIQEMYFWKNDLLIRVDIRIKEKYLRVHGMSEELLTEDKFFVNINFLV